MEIKVYVTCFERRQRNWCCGNDPDIMHRRGRTFIGEGDYIIIDGDGTKHVCGKDKIFKRYQVIGE